MTYCVTPTLLVLAKYFSLEYMLFPSSVFRFPFDVLNTDVAVTMLLKPVILFVVVK